LPQGCSRDRRRAKLTSTTLSREKKIQLQSLCNKQLYSLLLFLCSFSIPHGPWSSFSCFDCPGFPLCVTKCTAILKPISPVPGGEKYKTTDFSPSFHLSSLSSLYFPQISISPSPNFLLLKKSLETTNPPALPLSLPLPVSSSLLLYCFRSLPFHLVSLHQLFSPYTQLSLPSQPLFSVHPIIIFSLMLIRPLANVFSLPPFPLTPFPCLPNPPALAFSPLGLPLLISWDKEPNQCFQKSVWALVARMKTPLLRKLTHAQPHATVSATLRSSASARSHCNHDHPNWGPAIKRKRSNHYQQVGPPMLALQAQL